MYYVFTVSHLLHLASSLGIHSSVQTDLFLTKVFAHFQRLNLTWSSNSKWSRNVFKDLKSQNNFLTVTLLYQHTYPVMTWATCSVQGFFTTHQPFICHQTIARTILWISDVSSHVHNLVQGFARQLSVIQKFLIGLMWKPTNDRRPDFFKLLWRTW